MVTRRPTPGATGLSDDVLLTEAQVRAGSPAARLTTAHPWVTDLAVAVLVVLAGLVGSMFAWEAADGARYLGLYPLDSAIRDVVATTWLVGTFAGAGLLLLRRSRPVTVTALLTVMCLASLVVAGTVGVLGVGVACALYSVAAADGPRRTWPVVAGVLVVLSAAIWRWEHLGLLETISWFSVTPTGPEPWEPARNLTEPPFAAARRTGSLLLLYAVLLLGVAAGSAARSRRLHAQDLVERYRALARERDQSAALARADERAHIAREMHDVVAHNLTVMVALADGADAAFDRAPRRAHDAVLQIASTGRSALVAMQSALGSIGPEDGVAGHGDGVAGHDDGVPGHRTTPTEIDLPTLVDRFRAAGVQVRVDGLEAELPDDTSLRLAVLRILGESLTNVLRHAPGARFVDVRVRCTPTAVELEVVDGGGTRAGTGGGTGRGVIGMQERAALLGGQVSAGPTPAGGWRVHARLPVRVEQGGGR